MDAIHNVPSTQHDKENASMNRPNSSTARYCKTVLSRDELQTMASKIRDSVANITDNEIWRNHEGLIECLVQLSFTMKASQDNVLIKKKMSVPLLNSCRKLVKESTVSADSKTALRLLRIAIHGIRAIVAAEGEIIPKPEAIIKLLYHIISTLDSIAHKKTSVSRLAAYYTIWSFETLGRVLRSCCPDFVVNELSVTIKSVFPVPRQQHKHNLSLSLSKEQLLTIGNHVILSCSRIFLLPLWHTDDSPLRMEEQLVLRCLPVAKKLKQLESFHSSANFICNLGRPWLLELSRLQTGGSLKESIALSRRAHKILWDCFHGCEEMVGPDAVLASRKQSIDCLLAIIPRQAHEINQTEKELFCTQFASACSQASKAITLWDQIADTSVTAMKAFLKDTGEALDCTARLLNNDEVGSYIEFCAYRALYGGSMDTQVDIQSNGTVNSCMFQCLPYRFQYSASSKVESQIDHAALAVVFLALHVVKTVENGQTLYQHPAVEDVLLGAVRNFESLVSTNADTSKAGLQTWFKILYKTSLNRVTSKAVESNAPIQQSHDVIFLAAQLLYRCCWPLAKVICSTIEGPKKSSVWDFGWDCLMKSISVYQKLDLLQYRKKEVRSCLNEIVSELCSKKSAIPPKCHERAAKLFALSGKNQIDQDMKEGAIFSMLHSVRLFMELSRNGFSSPDFQISLRWSAIGSTYSSMGSWKEATVAFVMALLQDVAETATSPNDLTARCWLTFFKFLGGLSDGIFHADCGEERYQSSRRVRLVFKIIQCLKEWADTKGGMSNSWNLLASPVEVAEILLQNERIANESSAVPFDKCCQLEDLLSILFRMDGLGFNRSSCSARDLEHFALLALLHNQIQKVACRDHQDLLYAAQRVFFRLLDENMQNLIRLPSEAFFGELSWIMLQTNEACISPRSTRHALSRLMSSLAELGRCPKGDWELLIFSFRLSLRARILMEEDLCEPESFDDFIADASRFSNCIGSCITAEGSFARECATGAMSRLSDYLSTNGYELAATFCVFWCREHSAAKPELLMPWSNSLESMHSNTDHIPLIAYSSVKSVDADLPTSCTNLGMKASYFLAAASQARSSTEIMYLKKEFDKLLTDSESITSLQKDGVSLRDVVTNHWVKGTILLGQGELEEINGNYPVALDCMKLCFSECNKIASLLAAQLPTDRNEAFQLRALRSQCTVRQINCLRHLCTIYHLTGDYRRAWGYAEVVWKDFSGLDTVSVPLKSTFSDVLSIFSSQVCKSPLQKLLRRNLVAVKIRSSSLDVVIDSLQLLTEEDFPLNTLHSNGEQIIDSQIEDVLGSLLIWDTFGSEYSSTSCEEIQHAEQLSKCGADSMLGSSLIVRLLQLAGSKLEVRQTICHRPLLDLDFQLRSLDYRLHRPHLAKIEKEDQYFLERIVADPFLDRSLFGRSLYILGYLSLSSVSRVNAGDYLDLPGSSYDDDAASKDLADVRHYFVSALQSPMAFSQQRIRDIYRCIALSSMGDGVSNKSICRFLASSIGRCLGGDTGAYTEKYNSSFMDISAVTSELNIEGMDDQGPQTAKVISNEAFDRLGQMLPRNCKIIMSALAPTGQLLASSVGSLDGSLTFETAKFPFEQQLEYSFYEEFLKPLDEIIYKSHEQLDTTGEHHSDDRKSKREWWELRQKLDSDLMELLTQFEKKCSSSPDMQSVFGVCTNKSSADTPRKKLISRFEEASHVYLRSSHNNDKGDPSNLKVPELRDELISYGFETKRIRKLRKTELVELVVEQRQAVAEETVVVEKILQDQEEERETVFLILDENLQRFPFESLSCFRGKSVCRMPSLAFMITMLSQRSLSHCLVDKSNVSYVIDPDSNLGATRDRLFPVISALNKSSGSEPWKGVVGRVPEDDFMQRGFLQKNGLLLYIGHGGGESLLSRSGIASLSSGESNTTRSSVILMGCSSGRLESVNRRNSKTTSQLPIHYEPEGIALSYLLAGAPCVVGNLWDVTDGDIDRYTESLLSSMFDGSGRSIAQCVADARGACKMKYLVGCAPICYGFPVFVQNERRNG